MASGRQRRQIHQQFGLQQITDDPEVSGVFTGFLRICSMQKGWSDATEHCDSPPGSLLSQVAQFSLSP